MFKSIKDLLERVHLNSKDIECLGKAGSLSELEPELNPLECGIYAKSLMLFFREKDKKELDRVKTEKKNDEKLLSYQESLSVWEREEELRSAKYQDRWNIRQKEINEKITKNIEAEKNGKRIVKVPDQISPYKPLEKPILKSPLEIKNVSESPAKPKEVLSQKTRLDLERDILGIYLSGHPLDGIEEDSSVTPIVDLLTQEEGGHCIIRGVCQFINERNTKLKKLMGSMQFEDRSGSIEVVIFPKVYTPLRDFLAAGKLYKIWGETSASTPETDNFDSDGIVTKVHVSFKATKIQEIVQREKNSEWMIIYPLLKGYMRILPGQSDISKSEIINIFKQIALKYR